MITAARTPPRVLVMIALTVASVTSCHRAATRPPEAPVAPGHWSTLNERQRIDYMKAHVMPVMGQLFKGYDPSYYDDPTCVLCHGKRALDGDFSMPNSSLPKLTTDGTFAKEKADEPEMTRFMMEKVVPAMVQALKVEPYDPATERGFGCFRCHTPKTAAP